MKLTYSEPKSVISEITLNEITEVLRTGEKTSLMNLEERMKSMKKRSNYSDLIESSALRTPHFEESVRGGSRGNPDDAVYQTMVRAEALREEEKTYLAGASLKVIRDLRAVQIIWDCFYELPCDLREVLVYFYKERKNAQETADLMQISESTFWRKKRKALKLMYEACNMARRYDFE